MTERELYIYNALKDNPNISKKDLAENLGVSVVSIDLSLEILREKGCILEDGSVNENFKSVTIVGGSNVDIEGKCLDDVIMGDSNIGKIKYSNGGVARNVTENFARLGGDIRFVTAISRDAHGRRILEQLKELNVDIEDCVITTEYNTSTYLYVLDSAGEMIVAVNDMGIINLIDEDLILGIEDKLKNSNFVFFDGNVQESVIQAIVKNSGDYKIVVDPVSVNKIDKIIPYLDSIYCMKLNAFEAGRVAGIEVIDENSAAEAGKIMLEKGLKIVYITLGDKGVVYCDSENTIYKKAYKTIVKNVTGAGDAFTGALLYALANDYDPYETIKLGMGASLLTIECSDTCASYLSVEKIRKRLENE